MNLSSDAKIIAALESFGRIEEQTYRNISALDYLRESVVECREGTWEIFTKRDFVFPYFIRTVTTPVNKFVAVFSGNRKFLIYGSFDSIEDLNKHLVRFARGFLSKPGTFLGIPRRLTYDNAQDYGYLRGLAAGIILMAADLSYSSVFKLQNGILTGFIEFIKQVYYGDPPLAIGVGIAGSGAYFGTLLIIIPILYGNFCVSRAAKLFAREIRALSPDFLDFEYGVGAERSLEEEYNQILEEKRKEAAYREIAGIWPGMEKPSFETLHRRVREGLFSAEDLRAFLRDARAAEPGMDIERFLDVILRFKDARPHLDISVRDPDPGDAAEPAG